MKSKSLPVFSILLLFFSLKLFGSSYDRIAQDWARKYLRDEYGKMLISSCDVQILANLAYLSWCRSAVTLEAQREMFDVLCIMWKGWQNTMQTRLDPGVDQPYSIPDERQDITSNFWSYARIHRTVGLTYSYAVKMILEKKLPENSLTLDAVVEMRRQARKIVFDSLIDIRQQLGAFFKPRHSEYIEQTMEESETRSIRFLEYLYAYVPQLALHSFVEANNLHDAVNQEGWNALCSIQAVGNQTWQAIEEPRADFYKAFYLSIFNVLRDARSEEPLFLMFDRRGIIPKEEQNIVLPAPEKLVSVTALIGHVPL